MNERTVDLIYFDGCPNAGAARQTLSALLPDGSWREWVLSSAATPERFRRYGSPTVLVDGRDVTGEGEGAGALACRADGAPSREIIQAALRTHPGTSSMAF
jgi:mercuric ion transport protein